MRTADDSESLLPLAEMKHLRVRSLETRGVWRVHLPVWPWKYKVADQERTALLERLAQRYPFQALWFPGREKAETQTNWTHYSPADPFRPFEYQFEGGWALFFFVAVSMPVGDISALPTDGESIMKLLDRLHAKASDIVMV
jgi:hypothetical protein